MENYKKELFSNILFNSISSQIMSYSSPTPLYITKTFNTKTYLSMRNGSHYHISHKNFIGFIPKSNNKELALNFTLNVEKSTEYRIILLISSLIKWSKYISSFIITNKENEIYNCMTDINNIATNYISTVLNSENSEKFYISISYKNIDNYFMFQNNIIYICNHCICIKNNDKTIEQISSISEKLTITKKYDLIICIAIYRRKKLLKQSIDLINSFISDLPFTVGIVLVYSLDDDYNFITEYDNVHYHYSPNSPLGSKWLSGVLYSRLYSPKTIMILGSDDMVSKNYLIYGYNKIVKENYYLVYSDKWYTYDSNNKKLFISKYKQTKRPRYGGIGAGRFWSTEFLDLYRGRIFDPLLNKSLDTFGPLLFYYQKSLDTQYEIKILASKECGILLYKGKHKCFNSLNVILKSQQISNTPFSANADAGKITSA